MQRRIVNIPGRGLYGGAPKALLPPLGPVVPLRQVYPVVPSFRSYPINQLRKVRDGRGIIVSVNGAAQTPITVTHNLGRIPIGARVLQNNGGLDFDPNIKLGTGTRATQVITSNVKMTNCLIRFE